MLSRLSCGTTSASCLPNNGIFQEYTTFDIHRTKSLAPGAFTIKERPFGVVPPATEIDDLPNKFVIWSMAWSSGYIIFTFYYIVTYSVTVTFSYFSYIVTYSSHFHIFHKWSHSI